ncbi:uncharacterized protein Z520_06281 [Fonsecaea multimorphosa CBS 102226]|uniref:WH1 domain-containing protein n=1 Tax=Fonsecaea multimorphosa CBS 102226 TaxID=1442371 RepID=A0A0D2IME4_9EURO|nr:uncharacterized protein Z520_06281 [Fonsecaea multimorphosa CBS 102226]KIX98201.1 hypothetical protein Z520_06281 [Fonsecaea multimorphosa CBS 102226]OAL22662.1 hypothetical protein AYO22_07221 [Fonsecaea multimorphosa]
MSHRHNNRRSGNSRRQQSVDFPRYPPLSQPQTEPPISALAPGPLPAATSAAALPTPVAVAPPQLAVQISDYESDNQGYQSDYPTKPPPPNRTNEELNLSVLKRHNPQISSILSIAPYAVVYEFSPLPQPEWTKTGVEGSLFICELTPGPLGEDRYSAIVLNRRGLNNFEAELREGENAGVEITGEYVIISFKEGYEQKIYGVYIFHDGPGTSTENAQKRNGELMKSLADHAGVSRQAAEAAASAATAQHTNGHMLQAEQTLQDQQASAPAPGQQISLQQLFGQQRSDDAAWSVRAHEYDGRTLPPSQPGLQQPDVLIDLFRKAGFGAR